MMNEPNHPEKRGLYRSRSGMIFGVCKGLAQNLDLDVTMVRLVVAVGAFFSFGTLALLYIAAALIMKPEPR